MKTTGIRNTAICVLLMMVFALVAESCKSSKHCGCGSDINGLYRPGKRHKY